MYESVKHYISFNCFSSTILHKECVLCTRSALTESDSTWSSGEITWNLYVECAYHPQGVHPQSFEPEAQEE
jgi:hypothetical protein